MWERDRHQSSHSPCLTPDSTVNMAKMSVILVASMAMVLAVQVQASPAPVPGGLGSVDVDQVLKNKRLFDNYVKCIMDKAPCSAEGQELKERLPKDLSTSCQSCTDNERARARKVISFLKAERKDVWEAFKKKYDPDSKWGNAEWAN